LEKFKLLNAIDCIEVVFWNRQTQERMARVVKSFAWAMKAVPDNLWVYFFFGYQLLILVSHIYKL